MISFIIFDCNVLIDSFGGDLEFYGEIVCLFILYYLYELESFQGVLVEGNVEKLYCIVYSFKGVISNFVVLCVMVVVCMFELVFKSGIMVDNVDELVVEMVVVVLEFGEIMWVDLELKV